MKGTFPIDKFQEIQTPFYYYDTNVLRQTLKTINAEAGNVEAGQAKLKVTIRAEVNMFMKAMVTKPLQDGVDKLAEMLSMIPY